MFSSTPVWRKAEKCVQSCLRQQASNNLFPFKPACLAPCHSSVKITTNHCSSIWMDQNAPNVQNYLRFFFYIALRCVAWEKLWGGESGKNKMRKRRIGSLRPSQFSYLSLMKLSLETEYKIKGKILAFEFYFSTCWTDHILRRHWFP